MTSIWAMSDDSTRVSAAVRENRGWFLALGCVLIVCGVAAIALPLMSTLATSLVIGVVLAVAGVMQIIHAFQSKAWSGFMWNLLVGVVELVGGVLIWTNPFVGAIAITVLIAAVFFVQGVAQVALSLSVRPQDGWIWLLISGIIALIVSVWLMANMPQAGLFAPGVLVGVALLFEGWAFVLISWFARTHHGGRVAAA